MRTPRFAVAIVFAALMACSAEAQTHLDKNGTVINGVVNVPNALPGAYGAGAAGIADATVLPAGRAAYFLDIVNVSATATVCVAFGVAATISANQCSAGEIVLPPLWHRSWEGAFVPTDAVHVISSAAGTPISIGAK